MTAADYIAISTNVIIIVGMYLNYRKTSDVQKQTNGMSKELRAVSRAAGVVEGHAAGELEGRAEEKRHPS